MPHRNENMKKFTSKVHGPPPSGLATKAVGMVKKDTPPPPPTPPETKSKSSTKYTHQPNPFTKKPTPIRPKPFPKDEVDPNELEDWFNPNDPNNPALNQPKSTLYGSSQ